MAKTFKDFMLECEMYPHSKENYDLMKECAELGIMEKYLEDQKFYQEHKEQLTAGDIAITESYFAEAVDENTMEAFTEKYKAASNSISGKIKNGLKRILKTFANLFAKIGNKFDETTSAGQNVLKKLNGMKLTDEQVADIKKIVDNAKGKDTSNFPVAPNQPYLKHIKLQYVSADNTFSELKNDLAAALSDKVVVASVFANKDGTNIDTSTIGAVPVETIRDTCYAVINGDKHKIVGALQALSSTWLDVKKNGMKINVNTKQIDKNAQELNDICSKIEQMGQENAQMAGAIAGAVNNAAGGDGAVGAKVMNDMNDAYSKITSCIGQSTRIYTKLNAYRSSVIVGLSNYLKSAKESNSSK